MAHICRQCPCVHSTEIPEEGPHNLVALLAEKLGLQILTLFWGRPRGNGGWSKPATSMRHRSSSC